MIDFIPNTAKIYLESLLKLNQTNTSNFLQNREIGDRIREFDRSSAKKQVENLQCN